MTRAIALAALLTACSFGLGTEVGGPQPNIGMGCDQAQQFAFTGRTSLDALGLNEFGGGPDSGRIGQIWVTADKVQMDVGPAPPGAGLAEPTRMVCVQWDDGSGMAGPVADNWRLPVTAEPPATPFPIAPIAVATMIATLIGVSLLAFRRERGADG
ncbi:MAG: hypothetical protein QOI85_1523 [Chloroflexota bacterium]|jgi:hypothetical protein|nr:hypothetical protein [Chloroflexota bacterium]